MLKNSMIRVSLIIIIILNSTFEICASSIRNDSVKRVVSILEEAIKTKEVDKLREIVAPEFSVSVATMPGALGYANQVLQNGKELDEISLLSVEDADDGGFVVSVKFIGEEIEAETSKILLDTEYKIKYIDYFDSLYGMFRYEPSELKVTIPFELQEESIILNVKINDSERPLRFLFDTGADGLAITTELGKEIGLEEDVQRSTSIVGAHTNISISRNNTLHLDSLSIPGQSIALFDDMGTYDGIVGLVLAKRFIVKVNFDDSVLELYSMGDYTPGKEETAVSIGLPDGLVQVEGALDLFGKGHIPGSFILDTGAGFNLVLFSPFVRKNRLLLSGFKYESQGSMLSLGHATHVYHGKAVELLLGNVSFKDIPITLQASSGNTDWNPTEAGSLGIKQLQNYNFTIDLVKKKLYLQER